VLADTGDFKEAVSEAMSGAMQTREMKPRLGRAAYVGKMMDESYAAVDPGVWGVAKLLEAF
jgi:dihydroxyacetone kinase